MPGPKKWYAEKHRRNVTYEEVLRELLREKIEAGHSASGGGTIGMAK